MLILPTNMKEWIIVKLDTSNGTRYALQKLHQDPPNEMGIPKPQYLTHQIFRFEITAQRALNAKRQEVITEEFLKRTFPVND
jgi:hypothetical protein